MTAASASWSRWTWISIFDGSGDFSEVFSGPRIVAFAVSFSKVRRHRLPLPWSMTSSGQSSAKCWKMP
jgi:hypothetical protein